MLKWKKDGTAKCGPWIAVVYAWRDHWTVEIRRPGITVERKIKKNEATAKLAAETWLKRQAEAMIRDLKGGAR